MAESLTLTLVHADMAAGVEHTGGEEVVVEAAEDVELDGVTEGVTEGVIEGVTEDVMDGVVAGVVFTTVIMVDGVAGIAGFVVDLLVEVIFVDDAVVLGTLIVI